MKAKICVEDEELAYMTTSVSFILHIITMVIRLIGLLVVIRQLYRLYSNRRSTYHKLQLYTWVTVVIYLMAQFVSQSGIIAGFGIVNQRYETAIALGYFKSHDIHNTTTERVLYESETELFVIRKGSLHYCSPETATVSLINRQAGVLHSTSHSIGYLLACLVTMYRYQTFSTLPNSNQSIVMRYCIYPYALLTALYVLSVWIGNISCLVDGVGLVCSLGIITEKLFCIFHIVVFLLIEYVLNIVMIRTVIRTSNINRLNMRRTRSTLRRKKRLEKQIVRSFTLLVLVDVFLTLFVVIGATVDVFLPYNRQIAYLANVWEIVHVYISFKLLDDLYKGLQEARTSEYTVFASSSRSLKRDPDTYSTRSLSAMGSKTDIEVAFFHEKDTLRSIMHQDSASNAVDHIASIPSSESFSIHRRNLNGSAGRNSSY